MKTIEKLKKKILEGAKVLSEVSEYKMTDKEAKELDERILQPLREISDMGETDEVLITLFELLNVSSPNILKEETYDVLAEKNPQKIAKLLLTLMSIASQS